MNSDADRRVIKNSIGKKDSLTDERERRKNGETRASKRDGEHQPLFANAAFNLLSSPDQWRLSSVFFHNEVKKLTNIWFAWVFGDGVEREPSMAKKNQNFLRLIILFFSICCYNSNSPPALVVLRTV